MDTTFYISNYGLQLICILVNDYINFDKTITEMTVLKGNTEYITKLKIINKIIISHNIGNEQIFKNTDCIGLYFEIISLLLNSSFDKFVEILSRRLEEHNTVNENQYLIHANGLKNCHSLATKIIDFHNNNSNKFIVSVELNIDCIKFHYKVFNKTT